jgi:hypothetical protein
MNPAVAHKGKEKSGGAAPRTVFIPFTHAAHEHTEAISDDSLLVGANVTARGPFDIPSYGYIRNVYLLVTTTGGVDGTAAATEDAPFNVLQNVSIEDVNGTPIVGPYNGDELFLVNKYGGYQFYSDPEQMPFYTSTPCTFNFSLRVPVEINPRTGLGCLSNMNSSATYKLRYSINQGVGGIVSALGTGTLPTVRVRAYLEAWSLPPSASRDGFPIQDEPPMLGTTQYWSKKIVNVSAGQQTIPLQRVGNQIRMLVAVFRNATPVRNDTNYPDPLTFAWDARTVFVEPRNLRQQYMAERYRYARVAKDTGVYVYDFAHDGNSHPGGEDDGHLWLRTVQASRLELTGSFGVAGTLTVLTNDVAPVATVGRFVEVNASGGVPGAGAGFNG